MKFYIVFHSVMGIDLVFSVSEAWNKFYVDGVRWPIEDVQRIYCETSYRTIRGFCYSFR